MQSLWSNGGTSFNSAVSTSISLLSGYENVNKNIILMSDGESSCSDTYINQAIANDIKIYTLGFGTASGDGILQTIANRTGGKFFKAVTGDELEYLYYMLGILEGADLTDSDNDGIPDIIETTGMRTQSGQTIKTDPNNPDCDGDGLLDGEEIICNIKINSDTNLEELALQMYRNYNGYYFTIKSDPNNKDSDGDGVEDDEDSRPNFVDENIYVRSKAIEYALKWCGSEASSNWIYNEDYYKFDNDCANFVSQCLSNGGVPMNNDWGMWKLSKEISKAEKICLRIFGLHSNSYWKWTTSWSKADSQFDYFRNFNNEIVVINNDDNISDTINNLIRTKSIKSGDLMYFCSGDRVVHATIITEIMNDDIKYSGHSIHCKNSSLTEKIVSYSCVKIIHFKYY